MGKGYVINPTDLYLVQQANERGFGEAFDTALVAGDYHSGPLSLLITFGIFGVFAFLAFGIAAIRMLYKFYQYSPPSLVEINTFLLAAFVARFIFFWSVFGAISSDLAFFAGLAGISVAINSGAEKSSSVSENPLTEIAVDTNSVAAAG